MFCSEIIFPPEAPKSCPANIKGKIVSIPEKKLEVNPPIKILETVALPERKAPNEPNRGTEYMAKSAWKFLNINESMSP